MEKFSFPDFYNPGNSLFINFGFPILVKKLDMEISGFKSFSPKVIGFSGSLDQLVYAAIDNLGIEVVFKPASVGEDVFIYKKRKNLPPFFREELIVKFLNFYFEKCSTTRKFYRFEFHANIPIELETLICALVAGINHSEKGCPEFGSLIPDLLKWSDYLELSIDPKLLMTAYSGGLRIFTGNSLEEQFRERFPKGFELVLLYSTGVLDTRMVNSPSDSIYNRMRVAAFLRGLFYHQIEFLQRGMETFIMEESVPEVREIASYFYKEAMGCGFVGMGATSDSHFLYSVFPNSLKAHDFYIKLLAFKGKNRYLKVFRAGVDEGGALVQ